MYNVQNEKKICAYRCEKWSVQSEIREQYMVLCVYTERNDYRVLHLINHHALQPNPVLKVEDLLDI